MRTLPIIPALKGRSQEDLHPQPVRELNGVETRLNYRDLASPQRRVRSIWGKKQVLHINN